MAAWAVSLLFFLLGVLHGFFCCCCMFLCVRGRKKMKFEVEMDDSVPSPFQQPRLSWRNESADDDEPLVDPTSVAEPTIPSSEYEPWRNTNQFDSGWGTT